MIFWYNNHTFSGIKHNETTFGVMAQLVARLNGIQEVTSSNLVSSTTQRTAQPSFLHGGANEPLEIV